MEDEDMFDMYDEFGNFIGEEEEPEEERPMFEEPEYGTTTPGMEEEENEPDLVPEEDAIVLYEDKKYYPEMDEVYGGAETMVEEEDSMAITESIVKDVKEKDFEIRERKIPKLKYDHKFYLDLLKHPKSIRNVAILGHLHHGKTQFLDIMIEQNLDIQWKTKHHQNYTDSRKDEKERKISVKASPVSFILQDSREKSYVFNMMDTPGHTNFFDEVCCGLRLSDGAVLVVDVIEGLMLGTENSIRYLFVIVVNKIDRLVLEMKIPPADAYLKIKHTIEEINALLKEATDSLPFEEKKHYHMSPLKGNVIFASGAYSFMFSLESFSAQYTQKYPSLNAKKFAKILWGNYYFNKETKKITKKPSDGARHRTFVDFILNPLYKILGYTVSYERKDLKPVLDSLGVYLKKKQYRTNSKDLLKEVCKLFFGDTRSLVDSVVKHIPSPLENTEKLINQIYTGDKNSDFFKMMAKCDKEGELVANVAKMYNKPNCEKFDCLARIISGTIKKGQTLKILGENYSLDDQEDMRVKPITNLFVCQSRFNIKINEAYAGNWVLIEGIDQGVLKTATIVDFRNMNEIEIFRPIKYNTVPFFKLALEPYIPSELPKLLEGLRKVGKSYPILETRVEESGEHLIIGTGEIYLDSVMHDLRNMYSEIEIKVSDPSVTFCETVIDTSSIKCSTQTPNKQNKFTMIAEPMDKGLAEEIELEHLDLKWGEEKVSTIFREKYKWDILAAQSVWAFGPDDFGPNILVNDTLPFETDKESLAFAKESIIHGFQWCAKEGPLCEEPIRNAKFKLLEAEVSKEPLYRAAGQIIPSTRRCCYSSFLMANPRIMEPTLLAEIQCSGDSLAAVYNVLNRRRGHLISENAKPGSPLFIVKANIPALDSFGFETDLRCHSVGQAFNSCIFDGWSVLPGDPLDKNIEMKILEPSTPMELAREVVIKLRRRKGLNEQISILKYFDDPNIIELLKNDDEYKKII